jgi:uncharacterized protein with HEPN domain
MWRDDAYVLDMFLAAQKVQKFVNDVSEDKFLFDEVVQNAVIHQIQIIGEAANKVTLEYRKEHTQIPWQQIVALRNRLVHEYFNIIPERVWEVVKEDIPDLIKQIEPLVPPDEPSKSED